MKNQNSLPVASEAAKREQGWANLQYKAEYLAQTLFNVRDANLAAGNDITDAPQGVRAALAGLSHELKMWEGKLAAQSMPGAP